MQLFSQQNFTLVRQIPDHTDPTTYYVRAVIRNALTDVILATLNLEDKGGQRFKKDWRVPADTSGEGFYVSVITSVYTDSGYTTKASSYGDDENTYLVTSRSMSVGGKGGGGGSLSIRDIRDVIKEELKPYKPKKITFPKQKEIEIPEYEMKWDQVLEAIEGLKPLLEKIPTEKTDTSPISEALKTLNEAISQIPTEVVDLTPVLSKLDEDRSEKDLQHGDLMNNNKDFNESLPSILEKIVSKVMKETNFITSFITSVHQNRDGKQDPEDEVKKINTKNLSL